MITAEGDALLSAVLGRGEAVDLLAYADWLTERNELSHLAIALRWCARRGRRPATSPRGQAASWSWHSRIRKPTRPDQLPPAVASCLRSPKGRWAGGVFRFRRGANPPALAAYLALGRALEELAQALAH